jgi:hypothetical protein
MYTKCLLVNLNGRDHSEDPGVDGKKILELILEGGKMLMDAHGQG